MKNALALVALASFSAACRAASPTPVPENLLACGKLQDPGERVHCYDTQIAAMQASAPDSAAPAAARSVTPTTSSVPVAPAPVKPAADSSPAAAAKTTPRAAPTSPAAPPEQRSAAKFGEELLPPTSRPAPPPQEMALVSNITALRAVGPNTYVISLSNGQVWRQEQASQVALFFRIGDDVRIEKGTLGSYHMSTASTGAKNWVRVTRIQ
jgi:hypothetical protein